MTNRIIMISRYHEVFRRPMRLTDMEGNIQALIPKPENMIICDGCNSPIPQEYIGCLSFKKGYIHSAQCHECIVEYFPNFKIVDQKDSEWK